MAKKEGIFTQKNLVMAALTTGLTFGGLWILPFVLAAQAGSMMALLVIVFVSSLIAKWITAQMK